VRTARPRTPHHPPSRADERRLRARRSVAHLPHTQALASGCTLRPAERDISHGGVASVSCCTRVGRSVRAMAGWRTLGDMRPSGAVRLHATVHDGTRRRLEARPLAAVAAGAALGEHVARAHERGWQVGERAAQAGGPRDGTSPAEAARLCGDDHHGRRGQQRCRGFVRCYIGRGGRG